MRIAIKQVEGKAFDKRVLESNWQPVSLSQAEFIKHISVQGKAFTVGIYKGGINKSGNWVEGFRTKDNFTQSDIIALDYDDLTPGALEELQRDPFITKNAFAITHSSSSSPETPKARVVFELSKTITNGEIYHEIIKMIVELAYPGADKNAIDISRAFFGDGKKRAPIRFNPGNILDVLPLIEEAQERITQRYIEVQILATQNAATPKINPYDERAKEYLDRIIQDQLKNLQTSYGHGNSALYHSGITLFGYAMAGYLDDREVENWLLNTPVAKRRPDREVRATLRSAKSHAQELHIPDPEQEPMPADPILPVEESGKHVVSMEYLDVRELSLQQGAYVIKSGIGTNKTGFAIKTIESILREKGGLWLVHRKTLSSNTSERLFKNKLVVEDYQDIDRPSRHGLDRLVLSINGLVTLEQLRPYPVVIIDEVEQLLATLLSRELFKGAEAVNALIRLEYIIKNAQLVLCMDAHAGGISYGWLKSIREDVTFVENVHQRPRKPLGRFINEVAALAHADQTIREGGGTVLIGCASATTAKSIRQRYLDLGLLKDEEMRCITQDTNGPDNQQFIRNINTELPKIKLLIYSPTMGTGVDVEGFLEDGKTQYIKAVYGLFSKRDRDFAVQDMLQMLGRARNAQAYYFELTTPKSAPDKRRSTSILAIYDMEYKRVLSSRKFVQQVINADGLPDITEPQKKLLKLFAKVRAAKNHSLNDLQGHFAQLCVDQYEIYQVIEGAPPSVKRELKAARAAVKDEHRNLLLTVKELHPKEYASKSISGLTEQDIAGYEKWLIRDAYGQEVTEEVLDHDNNGRGRVQLATFCSLTMKETDIAQTDWESIAEGHALHLIRDSMVQRRLMLTAIRSVWGNISEVAETNINPVSKEQIMTSMSRYLEENKRLLKYHFRWRTSYSDDPLDALRRIMKRAGLEVQLIRNQERFSEGEWYRVSKGSLAQMMDYRKSRLEHLKQKAVAREQTTRFGYKNLLENHAA